ncbi:MAG: hypothetical protein WDN06_02045 [Asticcacaulis sp.]
MPLNLDHLLDAPLPPGTKGLPRVPPPFRFATSKPRAGTCWPGMCPCPWRSSGPRRSATICGVMQAYLDAAGVRLAPHGKTTLCPQLFERQLDGGAWGITVATVSQLVLCHDVGVERVVIANEVVGPAEVALPGAAVGGTAETALLHARRLAGRRPTAAGGLCGRAGGSGSERTG